jgi:hypothetical protein
MAQDKSSTDSHGQHRRLFGWTVGGLGLSIAIVLFVAVFHSGGTSKDSPSFQYGTEVMDRLESVPGFGQGPSERCHQALIKDPPGFTPYSLDEAQAGCVSEWNGLNR